MIVILGIYLAVIVSIGIPLIVFIYACFKKYYIPFLLGVVTFMVSQVLLRIPLLEYLAKNSSDYLLFSATNPILFAIVVGGLSAGIFEEMSRFLVMRFMMKLKEWKTGFIFGVGHGGIEAVIFVGISAFSLLFSPTAISYNESYAIAGVERFFAIVLHVGLSIIVLQGVVQKRFRYVLLAVLIHTFVNSLAGILPFFVPKESLVLVLETTIAVFALLLFCYSLILKRKGVLQ